LGGRDDLICEPGDGLLGKPRQDARPRGPRGPDEPSLPLNSHQRDALSQNVRLGAVLATTLPADPETAVLAQIRQRASVRVSRHLPSTADEGANIYGGRFPGIV
jgi:hypothetical protein